MPVRARSTGPGRESGTARRRRTALTIGVSCLVAAGGVLGYLELFTKGLDRLPDRPCSGAVERSTAAAALPAASEAEERGKLTVSDGRFTFYCYVRTADSTISGEAESADASPATWKRDYATKRDGNVVAVSSGGVQALSLSGLASVYVPCTPPGRRADDAVESHALIVEARTIGETRVEGAELRQVVTDFAYQLARHAYEAGKCQETRKFPDELPRLTSN